jgi:hypothetical protein
VSISAGSIISGAISECFTRSSSSPTISRRRASSASRSSVTDTEPSREFSTGTRAKLTEPSLAAFAAS